jgi:hypothetical protein
VLVCVSALGAAFHGRALADFEPPCTLPFAAIAQKHDIDEDCEAAGSATNAAHRAQNEAKNNFCASGDPVRVTYVVFKRLQSRVDELGIPYGHSSSLPSDRSQLRDLYVLDGVPIGEGTLVRYSAYVLAAHYSNTSKGESVNCQRKKAENNDIHVVLGKTRTETDFCNSVTAEISPHFRPETWTPANLERIEGRPLRFTGQLLFDGSHKPCENGEGSPRRVSVWEIHPVYGIDVCRNTTLSGCSASNDAKWVPLEEWLNLTEHPDE